jgi:hypothetical protein
MKFKIIVSVFALLLGFNSYASFPVERVGVNNTSTMTTMNEVETILVSPAAAQSEKSQGIALILGFFLGAIAGHKWYLGNPWYINVLFIITLGGLGIWWIIDMIRIITGDYQPHNGSYKGSFF